MTESHVKERFDFFAALQRSTPYQFQLPNLFYFYSALNWGVDDPTTIRFLQMYERLLIDLFAFTQRYKLKLISYHSLQQK